jgi:hypothetical protein
MKMVRQILDGAMLAHIALRSDPGGRSTVPVTRPYDLVEGTFIEVLDALFNGTILNHQKAPGLAIAPIGRGDSSLKDLADQFVRHRVRLEPAHGPRGVDNIEDVSTAVGHTMLLLEQVMCADGIS